MCIIVQCVVDENAVLAVCKTTLSEDALEQDALFLSMLWAHCCKCMHPYVQAVVGEGVQLLLQ